MTEVHTPEPGDGSPDAAGNDPPGSLLNRDGGRLEGPPSSLDLDAIEAHLRDEVHVIDLREDGWTIKHTFMCRSLGLFTCSITQAAQTDLQSPPPEAPGRYIVDLDPDGFLVIGHPLTDHEETIDVPALVRELRATWDKVVKVRLLLETSPFGPTLADLRKLAFEIRRVVFPEHWKQEENPDGN